MVATVPTPPGYSVDGWTWRPSIRQNISRVSAADLQRLAVELPGERVQRPHDVRDGAVAVVALVGSPGVFRLGQDAGVGFGHHLFAVVHADEVFLEDVVVEHVLGGLAEIHDPLAQVRRLHAVRHVLCVAGAGGVVVAANSADAAGDEVGIPRVLALHEDGIAAEDRGRALALHHLVVLEIDLGVDAEAADDPRDGIPVHLHQIVVTRSASGIHRNRGGHCASPVWKWVVTRCAGHR